MVQEQFVFTEFLKKDMQLKFWQTKSKAEVDFIIEKNNKQYPLEIKTMLTKAKTTRSFMNFLQEYKPEKSFILSDELETIITKQKQQHTKPQTYHSDKTATHKQEHATMEC